MPFMRANKPKRLGVYAGSFDPLTVGHLWMIEQGVLLFDRLVVAIGTNLEKRYTFTLDERMAMLRDSLKSFRNISLVTFSDRYLIDFAQSLGATHVLRGIRSESDYEYERTMRNINGDLDGHICTVFLMPPRDIAEVSSSMVKNLVGPQGWQKVVRKYVPNAVYRRLLNPGV
jgi:pantetheine-phosphate adenylyltransferase